MIFEKKYKIHSKYTVVFHSPNRVEFRVGVWNVSSVFVEDQEEKGFLASIIKALDGAHTSRDLSKKFKLPISQIEGLIDHLHNLQVLNNPKETTVQQYFTDFMPFITQESISKIEKPILLLGDASVVTALAAELKKVIADELIKEVHIHDEIYQKIKNTKPEEWLLSGLDYFRHIEGFKDWKEYFVVLAFANVDPVFTKNFNRIAHELNIDWIHVAVDGPFLLIGPTFLGGKSPCYECLENRILMNLRERANYQTYKNALVQEQVVFSGLEVNPLILPLLKAHALIEIINFLATGYTFTLRKMLGIYLPTMEMAYNELMPLSICSCCGPVTNRTDEQLYFDMQTQLVTENSL
jgi:bacteriocin biosynthesis cyclodehydratase domain-containing protein